MTKRVKRCLLCHKKFRNRERLSEHLLMAHDVLPYKAPIVKKKPKIPRPVEKKASRLHRLKLVKAIEAKKVELKAAMDLLRKDRPDAPPKVLKNASANWRRIKRDRKRAMNVNRRTKYDQSLVPVPVYRKDFVDGK